MSASAPATSARRIEQTRRVLLVSTRARGLHAKFGFVPPPHVERFMEITTADPQGVGALPATKLREFIVWGRSLPQPVN